MNKQTFMLAALAGGMVLPIQVALNALLRRSVGQPMQVTFISYAVGAMASLLICLAARYPLPTMANLAGTSWWMWCAGCLGTIYVWSTIFATPQIGAALALSLTVAGQMLAALAIDHFGLLGLDRYPMGWPRFVGIILMIGGVGLIAFTKK